MTRKEYRVAHTLESFLIGVLVAAGVSYTLYKNKEASSANSVLYVDRLITRNSSQQDEIEKLNISIKNHIESIQEARSKIRQMMNSSGNRDQIISELDKLLTLE